MMCERKWLFASRSQNWSRTPGGPKGCSRIWPNGSISLPVYTCLASDLLHIVDPGSVIDFE